MTPPNISTQENKDSAGELSINYHFVKKSALILRALNHKLRQQMIKFISEHDKITVTEIYVKLKLEQSVASQHLAILRLAGIVLAKREGKFIYYTLNRKRLEEVGSFVNDMVG